MRAVTCGLSHWPRSWKIIWKKKLGNIIE
jgi:hypothetical protein